MSVDRKSLSSVPPSDRPDHDLGHDVASVAGCGPCCSRHKDADRLDHEPKPTNRSRLTATVLEDGRIRTPIRILQMDCPTEEALIRRKLSSMEGVGALDFDLMQRVLTVTHLAASRDSVVAAVQSLGFTPELADDPSDVAAAPAQPSWSLLLCAGLLALAAEIVHALGESSWISAALALLAIVSCGLTTYRKGWVAIRHLTLNINALMSIAVTGAALLGNWPEAAMVMALFSLAERIEARSLGRAREALQGLLALAPPMATVRGPDGSWHDVDAQAVLVGAQVRVKPGERIALDGRIVAGRSAVNQAPITGESLPIDKSVGDPVYAGTINESGSFEFAVTARANDSTLARIIAAVERAQGARAPTQRFVDRFASIYTPIVFGLALLMAIVPPLWMGGDWWDWAYRALVLLVIACPCALVIATPVTVVSGLTAAARQGILIKGGVYLENGCRLRWLALDKTGTLTLGKPALTEMRGIGVVGSPRADQVHPGSVAHVCADIDTVDDRDTSWGTTTKRGVAAQLAQRSDHAVSRAIAEALKSSASASTIVDDFEAVGGRGVRGKVEGQPWVLGNPTWMRELGFSTPELATLVEAFECRGHTVTCLADATRVCMVFAVADTLREHSRQTIAELHALGVRTVLLSGDNANAVAQIASAVGIDEARSELLPEDKRALIAERQRDGSWVGMVGDGINDAPALAQANIGFAMGAAGSGTAIETADVALMDDDLRKLPRFVRLSRKTHKVLWQNISIALGIKVVFVVLTLVGVGTMWMAVFADMGASLIVVANGLRLLRESPILPRSGATTNG